MGINKLLTLEVWGDRLLEKSNQVNVGKNYEPDDHANDECTRDPKQTLPQFLEVVEERHFGIFGSVPLHCSIARVISRAPAPLHLKRGIYESAPGKAGLQHGRVLPSAPPPHACKAQSLRAVLADIS